MLAIQKTGFIVIVLVLTSVAAWPQASRTFTSIAGHAVTVSSLRYNLDGDGNLLSGYVVGDQLIAHGPNSVWFRDNTLIPFKRSVYEYKDKKTGELEERTVTVIVGTIEGEQLLQTQEITENGASKPKDIGKSFAYWFTDRSRIEVTEFGVLSGYSARTQTVNDVTFPAGTLARFF